MLGGFFVLEKQVTVVFDEVAELAVFVQRFRGRQIGTFIHPVESRGVEIRSLLGMIVRKIDQALFHHHHHKGIDGTSGMVTGRDHLEHGGIVAQESRRHRAATVIGRGKDKYLHTFINYPAKIRENGKSEVF